MGFGPFKKKAKVVEAPAESQTLRKSRRIVSPGGKPAEPADASAPAAAPTANKTAIVKPSAPRAPPSDRVMRQPSAPIKVNEPEMIAAPSRPKGKDPIAVGSSKPPEFSGGLGSSGRRDGPCRSGDSALLDFLRNKAKLLNDDQVAQVREKSNNDSLPIDVAAVEMGFITEEQMVNALTQECWVPHLKVDKYEIRKKALDTIAREDATHFGVFPVDKLGSLLTLAMVNPLDAETIRVLESKTGLDIKKVVATRTEIAQGIEKYYSGKVQAKDSSLAFTQDVEPKSVTQMMSKVGPTTPAVPPSRPMPVVNINITADNIVPEIQDIDDLLSSDEAIAPAIIEPISLKAEAEVVPVEPVMMESFEPELATIEPMIPEFIPEAIIAPPARPIAPPKPAVAQSANHQDGSGDFEIADIPALVSDSANDPTLTKKHAPLAPSAPPAPVASSIAPEFEIDHGTPVAKPPVAAPAAPAARTPAKPPAPIAPPASNRPPAVAHPAGSSARTDSRPATSRFAGTGRSERSGIINLIPVTEEEFQHAITHGKSHVFEKWVGLQSRNRIINAVSIEAEFDVLLAGLYAGAKAV